MAGSRTAPRKVASALVLCGAIAAIGAAPSLGAGSDGTFAAGEAVPMQADGFFADGEQSGFESALSLRGLAVDSAEDFEDASPPKGLNGLINPAPNGVTTDPLDASTDDDLFQPGQIPAALRFQSNADKGGAGGPDPVGDGLAVGRPSSAGEHGSPTTISSPFTQEGPVSTDVVAVDAAHEAYALDVSLVEFSFVEPGQPTTGGPLTVRVFDEAGASIDSTVVEVDEIGPFLGYLAPEGTEIGRINISEPGGSELIHSVVAYDADGGNDSGNGSRSRNLLEDLLSGLGLG